MKTVFLLLLIVIVAKGSIAQEAKAQDGKMDCREKMMVGLKAGMCYSSAISTNGADFHPSYIGGFVGGVFINIPIAKLFGVQGEVLYCQKGFHATGSMFGEPYEFTRNTTFVDFPVLFVFMPNQYLSILAGPQLAYLLSQKNVFQKSSTNGMQESAFNADNSRKNSLGVVLGFDINFQHFVLGERAGLGLLNNSGIGTAPTPSYRNLCFKTTIGYRFNIRNVCGNDDRRNY